MVPQKTLLSDTVSDNIIMIDLSPSLYTLSITNKVANTELNRLPAYQAEQKISELVL